MTLSSRVFLRVVHKHRGRHSEPPGLDLYILNQNFQYHAKIIHLHIVNFFNTFTPAIFKIHIEPWNNGKYSTRWFFSRDVDDDLKKTRNLKSGTIPAKNQALTFLR